MQNSKLCKFKSLTTSYKLQATSSEGFGIIEVLIASAIIVMVVGSTVLLGRLAIRGSMLSAQRTQVYNLQREGIEFIRYLRDTKWINNMVDDWNSDFSLVSSSDKYFKINWEDKTISATINNSDSDYEDITLDTGEVYQRIVKVVEISSGINTEMSEFLAGSNVTYSNDNVNSGKYNTQLTKVSVIVKYDPYGQEGERIPESSVFLTNWKPGL